MLVHVFWIIASTRQSARLSPGTNCISVACIDLIRSFFHLIRPTKTKSSKYERGKCETFTVDVGQENQSSHVLTYHEISDQNGIIRPALILRTFKTADGHTSHVVAWTVPGSQAGRSILSLTFDTYAGVLDKTTHLPQLLPVSSVFNTPFTNGNIPLTRNHFINAVTTIKAAITYDSPLQVLLGDSSYDMVRDFSAKLVGPAMEKFCGTDDASEYHKFLRVWTDNLGMTLEFFLRAILRGDYTLDYPDFKAYDESPTCNACGIPHFAPINPLRLRITDNHGIVNHLIFLSDCAACVKDIIYASKQIILHRFIFSLPSADRNAIIDAFFNVKL